MTTKVVIEISFIPVSVTEGQVNRCIPIALCPFFTQDWVITDRTIVWVVNFIYQNLVSGTREVQKRHRSQERAHGSQANEHRRSRKRIHRDQSQNAGSMPRREHVSPRTTSLLVVKPVMPIREPNATPGSSVEANNGEAGNTGIDGERLRDGVTFRCSPHGGDVRTCRPRGWGRNTLPRASATGTCFGSLDSGIAYESAPTPVEKSTIADLQRIDGSS